MQLYAAIRYFRNGKQILHKLSQPLRIIVYVVKNTLPSFRIQSIIAVQQRVGVAGNGGQRGSKIMGNRTQKIRTKLFVLCKDGSFFLFSGVAQVIQRQGTFTENVQ